jgi:hypothetical protein
VFIETGKVLRNKRSVPAVIVSSCFGPIVTGMTGATKYNSKKDKAGITHKSVGLSSATAPVFFNRNYNK